MPSIVARVAKYSFLVSVAAVSSPLCVALEVNLTEVRPYVEVDAGSETMVVKRIQDTSNTISGFFAKTSRPCPPFCIRPMVAAPGVRTIGEYELFDFMSRQVRDGLGFIVDARTPDWYQRGTIPGAINFPWDRIVALGENPDGLASLFEQFDVTKKGNNGGWHTKVSSLFGGDGESGESWDFGRSKELILFCNGLWSDQAPRAITALIETGYPREKILYYRGGMQTWVSLGLTTAVPQRSD